MSVDNCSMGKFGSMVVLAQTESPDNQMSVEELGRQLCQHTVGMSPKSIGSLEEEEQMHAASEQSDEAEQIAVAVSSGASTTSGTVADDHSESDASDEVKEKPKDDEMRLVFQDFLMDESLTVGELLRQNSAEVTDFVRFGCGEELEGEEDAGT